MTHSPSKTGVKQPSHFFAVKKGKGPREYKINAGLLFSVTFLQNLPQDNFNTAETRMKNSLIQSGVHGDDCITFIIINMYVEIHLNN